MSTYNKILLALTILAVFAVAAMASLRNQTQENLNNKQQKIVGLDESQWPVTNYETPKPTDERNHASREAKNKRHNNSIFGVKEAIKAPPDTAHMITLTVDWEVGLSPLPVDRSDMVVMGEVADAQAFLSTDQSGIYSEFTVRVEEVLKRDGVSPVASGDVITVVRPGGRVRALSGRIQLFRVAGQDMPLQGRRYVVFLQRKEQEHDFDLLTGYELRAGKVFPLDAAITKFEVYKGTDEASFLQAVRNTLTQP